MNSASCNPFPVETCWNTKLYESIVLTFKHTKREEECNRKDLGMHVNFLNTPDDSVTPPFPLPQVKTTYPFRSQESIHSVTHSFIYCVNQFHGVLNWGIF